MSIITIEMWNEKKSEISQLKGELEEVKYDRGVKHDMAAEQIEALELQLAGVMAENSHLWVRIESGEAAAYEQGKAEARQEVAREIIRLIKDYGSSWEGRVYIPEIKSKFGLEG